MRHRVKSLVCERTMFRCKSHLEKNGLEWDQWRQQMNLKSKPF